MATRFNHLNVPDQWNNYWSKYPNGYTILEALLNWVKSVDDMTDNLNEINTRLDDFINQFDENLQAEVSALLSEWRDDGTFNDIIQGAIFTEFVERLDDLALNPVQYDTIQLAITDAVDRNRYLDLGNTTHIATGSLTGLHEAKLKGTGGISRDGLLFWANPRGTQTNTLYVNASSGNDTYDGITPDRAFRTLQRALDVLAIHGQHYLSGQWIISLASGTYAGGELRKEILSENFIEIAGADVGGHPTVPTTIISEGTGISSYGLLLEGRFTVKVKNIKVVGYNGTTSSQGISFRDGADIRTENVHTSGNYWGISGLKANMEVPDGIHENNGFLNGQSTGNGGAFRSLQLNRHHIGIQNAGSRANTAIIRNNTAGVFIQESSTGHVDWCTIEGNVDGVLAGVNGRANTDGCLFQNNQRDIRASGNSHIFVSTNTVFGSGTNESQTKLTTASGAELTTSRLFTKEMGYSAQVRYFNTQYVNKVVKNTTSEPVVTEVIKANMFRDVTSSVVPMKRIRIRVNGEIMGTSGIKRVAIRFGTKNISFTHSATTTGFFHVDGYIDFVEQEKQLITGTSIMHLGSVRLARELATNTLITDTELTIEAQTDDPVNDSVRIDFVELGYGG